MVGRLLLVAVLLWPAPVTGQEIAQVPGVPPCEVTRPAKHDTRVTCGDVEIGLRDNPDGTREELKRERSLLRLGAKVWKAKKIDRVFLPEREPVLASDATSPALRDALLPSERDTPMTTFIDVCFFYSDATSARVGNGHTGMVAFSTLAAALASESAANSGSPDIQVRVADVRRASYQESGQQFSGKPLSWMSTVTNGGSAEVRACQEQRGADAAHLITADSTAVVGCGVGVLNAFSYLSARSHSQVDCTNGNLTFAHELGHNLNLKHDPANAGCPSTGCTSDNYAHFTSAWRTILSYGGQPRLRYFSNPAVLINGVPSGVAGSRDNARTLRLNAPRVAALLAPVVTSRRPSPVTRVQAIQE
jgi:hypothetical protein